MSNCRFQEFSVVEVGNKQIHLTTLKLNTLFYKLIKHKLFRLFR